MTRRHTLADVGTLLLTGAQGFLGRNVARAWLRRYPEGRVVGVGRSPYSDGEFTHDHMIRGIPVGAALPRRLAGPPVSGSLEYRRLDLTDGLAVRSLMLEVGPGTVIHGAAALHGEPLERLIDSNVLATSCVARAASELANQPTLVLVSSGAVYGLHQPARATTDGPDSYALTKRAAERAAAMESSLTGLGVVSARVFNLVGAGLQDRHLLSRVSLDLATMQKGEVRRLWLGPLDALRDVIDVQDAAEGVVAAACADRTALQQLPECEGVRVLDVGTGDAHRMRDIVHMQIAAMGLEGVEVVESEGRPSGASVLRADPAGLALLGALPRVALEDSLAEMAAYARSQV